MEGVVQSYGMGDFPPSHPFHTDAHDPPQRANPAKVTGFVPVLAQTASVLLDTGAHPSDYADSAWLTRHQDKLAPYVVPCNHTVLLGDHLTVAPIRECIQGLEIELTDAVTGEVYSDAVDFLVFDQHQGNDLVLGTDTIGRSFRTYLDNILKRHTSVRPQRTSRTVASELQSDLRLSFPYVHNPLDLAPEDTIVDDLPDEYDICAHLQRPYGEVVKEFMDHLEESYSDVGKSFNPQWKEIFQQSTVLDCFCFRDWTGLKGIPPAALVWSPDTPKSHTAYMAQPAPALRPAVERVWRNMRVIMYEPASSPLVSPLVIVRKAGPDEVRLCGGYNTWCNKFLERRHWIFPQPLEALERLQEYPYYSEVDFCNSFNQIPITLEDSRKLCLLTPFGTFRPKFLPFGLHSGSAIEQETYEYIFGPIAGDSISIHDGMILMGRTPEELQRVHIQFFALCAQYNVKLKGSKCHFFAPSIKFFGYVIENKTIRLDDDRIAGIVAIKMPTSKKSMQQFLGAANFCCEFVPRFSDLRCPLDEMTHADFDWNPSTWKTNYVSAFEAFKKGLLDSMMKHMPDYSLSWGTMHDASSVGVCSVLFQLMRSDDGVFRPQMIALTSQRFSKHARNWPVPKREAYAIVHGHMVWRRLLTGKWHTVETDHANIQYIETSTEPICSRWLQFLQHEMSYSILFKKGRHNLITDYMSRAVQLTGHDSPTLSLTPAILDSDRFSMGSLLAMLLDDDLLDWQSESEPDHELHEILVGVDPLVPPPPIPVLDVHLFDPVNTAGARLSTLVKQVHGGTGIFALHQGARRTWQLLNVNFPGHGFSFQDIQTWVANCPTCQKVRLPLDKSLKPTTRNLRPLAMHSTVGIDFLTVTPTSKSGNVGLAVIVNLDSKHTFLYPVTALTAEQGALAMFTYYTYFGSFSQIRSDPGSHFTAHLFQEFIKLLGSAHLVSIVDRHESCGVESTNGTILSHLRALVHDQRQADLWDKPQFILAIHHVLNNAVSSESGFAPNTLTFGDFEGSFRDWPRNLPPTASKFVKELTEHIKDLHARSAKYQLKLMCKRTGSTNDHPNLYKPGDFVLWAKSDLDQKLDAPMLGPFKVLKHDSNSVTLEHPVSEHITERHSSRCKLFSGTPAQAYEAAKRDGDQFTIVAFLAWRGNPDTRTRMQFLVEFEGGDTLWMPWSQDLTQSAPYVTYCLSIRPLEQLTVTLAEQRRLRALRSQQPITSVAPGQIAYWDMRSYGPDWFDNLDLPHATSMTYVVAARYGAWADKRERRISARIDVFNETFPSLNNDFIYVWGDVTVFDPLKMILVDTAMVTVNPRLMAVPPARKVKLPPPIAPEHRGVSVLSSRPSPPRVPPARR
jgi:RNase H-like domain found in reverse transcriptase/Integrase zinc binding domain